MTGPTAPYRIASLTKVFTATALLRALGAAGIPLHTPVAELLPALAADWCCDPGISVEQLLAQVSGLRETVDAATVAALGDGPDALPEAARLVVRAGSVRAPGDRWSYYNGNYFLAGAALATVAGTTYEEALHRFVLAPWGLADTGFAVPPVAVSGWDGTTELPPGAYPRGRRPSGGLWSSVSDLLPEHDHVAVLLANEQHALPALARALDDLQHPLTGDRLAAAIDGFAA